MRATFYDDENVEGLLCPLLDDAIKPRLRRSMQIRHTPKPMTQAAWRIGIPDEFTM